MTELSEAPLFCDVKMLCRGAVLETEVKHRSMVRLSKNYLYQGFSGTNFDQLPLTDGLCRVTKLKQTFYVVKKIMNYIQLIQIGKNMEFLSATNSHSKYK